MTSPTLRTARERSETILRTARERSETILRTARERSEPLSDGEALALADLPDHELPGLMDAAAAARDRAFGRHVTFSPKVFLPLTNLCKNFCDYCSFRRSPKEAGAWTMSP